MDKEWSKDTGILFAIILTVSSLVLSDDRLAYVSVVLMASVILWPAALRPIGWLWHTIAQVIHRIVSPLVFSVIFFVVITPLGALWRISKRRIVGLSTASAFVERRHRFEAGDMLFPY